MSDVEFSEEKEYDASLRQLSQIAAEDKKGFISSLPIIFGLAKDETGANIVLISVGITAFLLAVGIFLYALNV